MSFHKRNCFNRGKIAEEKFFSLVNGTQGSAKEDVKDHVDGRLPDGTTVDVKSYRKAQAQGYVLVEFKNVAGNHGWASKQSKADIIALEFEGGFLSVPKDQLRNFALKKVWEENKHLDVWRANSIPARKGLYRLCGREKDTKGKKRKDVFTYIKKEDLKVLDYKWYPFK